MDSQSHKFWVVYALPEGLVQAQIPDNAATVVYSASEKDLFNKQGGADKPTNGSRGGTLLRGQDQPDFLGIIEEQVQDTPGSGVDRVPGRIMPMNFCPVDRLHFQSNNLGCFLTTLISDKFCRDIEQANVAVADNQESQPLPDRIQT